MSRILTLKERTEKIANINSNISVVPDDVLPDILIIINNAMNRKQKDNDDNLTRFDMIQSIEKNIKYCKDRDINEIENIIFNKEESTENKMLRITLEIVNKVLEVNDKPKISDLCDFKLTRDEFLRDEVIKIFDDNKKYIYDNGFDKKKCKAYQSKIVHKHVSVFRGMLKQIDYVLVYKTKFKTSNYVKTPYTMYYISKTNNEDK
jgi:hypothetical protein